MALPMPHSGTWQATPERQQPYRASGLRPLVPHPVQRMASPVWANGLGPAPMQDSPAVGVATLPAPVAAAQALPSARARGFSEGPPGASAHAPAGHLGAQALLHTQAQARANASAQALAQALAQASQPSACCASTAAEEDPLATLWGEVAQLRSHMRVVLDVVHDLGLSVALEAQERSEMTRRLGLEDGFSLEEASRRELQPQPALPQPRVPDVTNELNELVGALQHERDERSQEVGRLVKSLQEECDTRAQEVKVLFKAIQNDREAARIEREQKMHARAEGVGAEGCESRTGPRRCRPRISR
eukprot:TRINITY_DN22402_c0_g1_i2.p1 TRINITY_DN22402_c0_g1~~TRINITY_DN22402_c0_g1_i2.p1  ORF type:complete len:329 (+),score=72.47 TRINITY_DN22402_c0_g1_i2:81-989(+)